MADSLADSVATMKAHDIPLTVNEALSGAFGMISLVSTIFLTLPQLIENYRVKSAAGVSLAFLLIWCVGDVANLAGALWAGLVPAVIAIGVYYCLSDMILIGQCLYYNVKNKRREKRLQQANGSATTPTVEQERAEEEYEDAEGVRDDEPLLSRRESHQSIVSSSGRRIPHHRRRSSNASRPSMNGHIEYGATMAKIAEDATEGRTRSSRSLWLKNTLSVIVICIIGVVVWVIAWKAKIWRPTPAPGQGPRGDGESEKKNQPVGAEILGYISAVLYLGARIPQIIKNYREKSCEGLSVLFFILSLVGNLTYGASILFHSIEPNYVITNIPWLIGSLGTMFEDITIFVQFHIYGNRDEELDEEAEVEHNPNGSTSAVE